MRFWMARIALVDARRIDEDDLRCPAWCRRLESPCAWSAACRRRWRPCCPPARSTAWICPRWDGPEWRRSRRRSRILVGVVIAPRPAPYSRGPAPRAVRRWRAFRCALRRAPRFRPRCGTRPSHSLTSPPTVVDSISSSSFRFSISARRHQIEAAGHDVAAVIVQRDVAFRVHAHRGFRPGSLPPDLRAWPGPRCCHIRRQRCTMCAPSCCISRIRSWTDLVSGTKRIGRIRS